jgi:hypothetical protein
VWLVAELESVVSADSIAGVDEVVAPDGVGRVGAVLTVVGESDVTASVDGAAAGSPLAHAARVNAAASRYVVFMAPPR